MEEILQHLRCIKRCKCWDICHIRWCNISSINSISKKKNMFFFNSGSWGRRSFTKETQQTSVKLEQRSPPLLFALASKVCLQRKRRRRPVEETSKKVVQKFSEMEKCHLITSSSLHEMKFSWGSCWPVESCWCSSSQLAWGTRWFVTSSQIPKPLPAEIWPLTYEICYPGRWYDCCMIGWFFRVFSGVWNGIKVHQLDYSNLIETFQIHRSVPRIIYIPSWELKYTLIKAFLSRWVSKLPVWWDMFSRSLELYIYIYITCLFQLFFCWGGESNQIQVEKWISPTKTSSPMMHSEVLPPEAKSSEMVRDLLREAIAAINSGGKKFWGKTVSWLSFSRCNGPPKKTCIY